MSVKIRIMGAYTYKKPNFVFAHFGLEFGWVVVASGCLLHFNQS